MDWGPHLYPTHPCWWCQASFQEVRCSRALVEGQTGHILRVSGTGTGHFPQRGPGGHRKLGRAVQTWRVGNMWGA